MEADGTGETDWIPVPSWFRETGSSWVSQEWALWNPCCNGVKIAMCLWTAIAHNWAVYVISLRYALHTLRETADIFGVTKNCSGCSGRPNGRWAAGAVTD